MKRAVVAGACLLVMAAAATGCAPSTPTLSQPQAPATTLPAESAPPQAVQVRSKAVDAAVDHLLQAYHDYGQPSRELSTAIVQNERATSDLYLASASLLPPPQRVPANQAHHVLFALHQARDSLRELDHCLSGVVTTERLAVLCVTAKHQANDALSGAFTDVFGLARYGTRSRAELRRLVKAATRNQRER